MELSVGKTYEVRVQRIIRSGIIVEMSDGSTELIHLSNISNEYVSDIHNFVDEGNIYVATCIVGKTKPTELSLRPLNLKSKKPESLYRSEGKLVNTNRGKPGSSRKPNELKKKESKSLDDMIADMNACYEEKMRCYSKKHSDGRKLYIPHRTNNF